MTEINKKLLKQAQDYVMIFLGLASYAFGFTAFILPEKVVTGGVTGVADACMGILEETREIR